MKAKENGRYVYVAYVEDLNVINDPKCNSILTTNLSGITFGLQCTDVMLTSLMTQHVINQLTDYDNGHVIIRSICHENHSRHCPPYDQLITTPTWLWLLKPWSIYFFPLLKAFFAVQVLHCSENTCSNLCGKAFLDYPKSDITQI